MATSQEIIDIIDALLEGRMTTEEARLWAMKETPKTDRCEDSPSALTTMVIELDPDNIAGRSENWKKELLLAREVLIRGVPCPNENRKAVEAYWMAYTPGEKVVLCQIRKIESGERVLEIMVEEWDRKSMFHEQIPIPVKKSTSLLLSEEEIKEKKNAYKKGTLLREEAVKWVIAQLQSETAVDSYGILLKFYWELSSPDGPFIPEYVEYSATKNTHLVQTRQDSIRITTEEKL